VKLSVELRSGIFPQNPANADLKVGFTTPRAAGTSVCAWKAFPKKDHNIPLILVKSQAIYGWKHIS